MIKPLLLLALLSLTLCQDFDISGQYEVRGLCNNNSCPNTSFPDGKSYFECPSLGINNVYISQVGKQYSIEMKADCGYVHGKYIQNYFDDSNFGTNPKQPSESQIQIPLTHGFVLVLQPCYSPYSHKRCPKHFYKQHIIGWKMRMGEAIDSCQFDLFNRVRK